MGEDGWQTADASEATNVRSKKKSIQDADAPSQLPQEANEAAKKPTSGSC